MIAACIFLKSGQPVDKIQATHRLDSSWIHMVMFLHCSEPYIQRGSKPAFVDALVEGFGVRGVMEMWVRSTCEKKN